MKKMVWLYCYESFFFYVFAWSYVDMLNLDTKIMVQRLFLRKDCKLVKKKLKRTRPDILIKIKEEVRKHWDVGFTEVVKYPQQVSNIVAFLKKNNKIRVCVDFRDLNKASLKYDFLMLHIDVLVDNVAKNSTYSFIDDFLRYNQIKMVEEDNEKAIYVTPWGTFYYKVIPFR